MTTDIISHFPGARRNGKGWACKCPAHNDSTASLSITQDSTGKWLFKCFAGCSFDAIIAAAGLTPADCFPQKDDQPERQQAPAAKLTEKAVYQYRDERGQIAYEVVRYEPKTFRQRRTVNGKTVWGMDGVTRYLYHLPEVTRSKAVVVVEGEKDADNLMALGITATCNVGGAGKWLDGYTDALAGKEITICPDNDEPGRKHADLIFESVAGKVALVRLVTVPAPHKDVSDWMQEVGDMTTFERAFLTAVATAPVFHRGIKMDIYSMGELERQYYEFVTREKARSLDISKWLTSAFQDIRPMLPGEMVVIMADTGVGKSAIAQNLSLHARPLNVLFFELELPAHLMFERFAAINSQTSGYAIEQASKAGRDVNYGGLSHVYVCPTAKLTTEDIENRIKKSELKIGAPADVVVIDYIGLVKAKGDRYERLSNVAEECKVIAKTCNVVMVVLSQIHRKPGQGPEITLHDAKDSGSIENSAGLVLGAWRDQQDKSRMNIKILKNTKGSAGRVIECTFDGPSLRITDNQSKTFDEVANA